jgi:hypothetical protein
MLQKLAWIQAWLLLAGRDLAFPQTVEKMVSAEGIEPST